MCANMGSSKRPSTEAGLYCPRCGRVGVSLYQCPSCAEDRAGYGKALEAIREAGGILPDKLRADGGTVKLGGVVYLVTLWFRW
jgi:hypothetical protein